MISEGTKYTSRTIVAEENCACTMGSGNLPVFATPALVALMENAAMLAVADSLPEGSTTVGGEISIKHLKPSAIGTEITATATLSSAEGRKLTFNVEAHDASGLVGEGTHVRFVVDKEKFMSRIS